MTNLAQVIMDKLRPYKFRILMIVFAVIFAAFGYFLYKRMVKPELKAAELGDADIANTDKSGAGQCEIILFKASWCPHCKNIAPEWTEFNNEYDNRRIGNYVILCKEVDCSDDDNEMSKKMIQKYGVEGFPTVKILMDGKVIEYDAKVSKDNLEQFINTVVAGNK